MEQLAMTEYSRQYTTAAQNRADCSQFMALKEGDRQVALGRLVALARPAPSSWQPGRLQAVSTVIPKVGASQVLEVVATPLCACLLLFPVTLAENTGRPGSVFLQFLPKLAE